MVSSKHVALPVGATVGPYRIDDVLGAGAWTITYAASDRNTRERVALREYFPELLCKRDDDGPSVVPVSALDRAEMASGITRFMRWSRTVATVRHENVTTVRRVMETNGTAYVATAFVDGAPLDALLRPEEFLDPQEMAEILPGLLAGLEAIHRAGLYHRCLHPGAIFVRRDAQPVLDLPAADWQVEDPDIEPSAHVRAYASPELLVREDFGAWSDIYSLCATLFRLITGKTPPPADTRAFPQHDRPDTIAHLLGSAQGHWPPALLDTVASGMALAPKSRPPSVAHVRARLEERVIEEPDTVPMRPHRRSGGARTQRLEAPPSGQSFGAPEPPPGPRGDDTHAAPPPAPAQPGGQEPSPFERPTAPRLQEPTFGRPPEAVQDWDSGPDGAEPSLTGPDRPPPEPAPPGRDPLARGPSGERGPLPEDDPVRAGDSPDRGAGGASAAGDARRDDGEEPPGEDETDAVHELDLDRPTRPISPEDLAGLPRPGQAGDPPVEPASPSGASEAGPADAQPAVSRPAEGGPAKSGPADNGTPTPDADGEGADPARKDAAPADRTGGGSGGSGGDKSLPKFSALVYRRGKPEKVDLPSGPGDDRDTGAPSIAPARFTLYHPPAVSPRAWGTLVVYLHESGIASVIARQEAERRAGPLTDRAEPRDDVSMLVRPGAEMLVVPKLRGGRINPPWARVQWLENFHRLEFRIAAAPDADPDLERTLAGVVTFYAGALLVGETPFAVKVADNPDGGEPTVAKSMSFARVFPSFASEERAMAERFAEAAESVNMPFLKQVLDLRSQGKDRAVRRLVARAERYQLCWSSAGSTSSKLRREWEEARSQRRDDFMRICSWDRPMPAPPSELADVPVQRLPGLDD